MPRGGARPGAGRPRGSHSRPRDLDAINRYFGPGKEPATKLNMRERIAHGEIGDPLEVLIRCAHDRRVKVQLRIHAAAQAMKYIHRILSAVAVQHSTVNGHDRQAQIQTFMQRLDALVPQLDLIEVDQPHNFATAAVRLPPMAFAKASCL